MLTWPSLLVLHESPFKEDGLFCFNLSYFQMVEFVGLSGPIKFDTSGLRTNFEMDLMELQLGGLVSLNLRFRFMKVYSKDEH